MTNQAPALTPDDLPTGSSAFIGYGREERATDPQGGDEPISVRSQVYVRYYPAINVLRYTQGGRSGNRDDLVTIEFDPQSVGLKQSIKAHVDADEPMVEVIKQAADAGQPVAVAIETQRKRKDGRSGEAISPLTPIHALRGCNEPNGSGDNEAMMGASNRTVNNRLAMVNGRGTKHILSDPREWASLVSNRAGDLPPAGWKALNDKDDWKNYGVAVRSTTAPVPQPSAQAGQAGAAAAPSDPTELVRALAPGLTAVIQQAVADEFAKQGSRPNKNGFYEGKPWDARTNNGMVNLGGYLSTGQGHCYRWAYDYLVQHEVTGNCDEAATVLADVVMTLADQVQAGAYGHGVQPDRLMNSHVEARRWVEFVITNRSTLALTEPVNYDPDMENEARQTWCKEVVATATECMSAAGHRAGEYLRERGNRPQVKKPADEAPAESGPSAKVVQAMLDRVVLGWDDQHVIGAIGQEFATKQWGGLVISRAETSTEDGSTKVTLTYPAAEGQQSGAVHDLLRERYSYLSGTAQNQQQSAPEPQEAPEPAPSQEAPQGTPQAQQQQSAPEPEAAPQQSSAAQTSPLSDQTRGFINHARSVTTLEQVRALYQTAQQGNMLSVPVPVAADGTTLTYGDQMNGAGFETWTVATVLNWMRERFEAQGSTQAPAAAEQQSQAPAPQQPTETPTEAPAEPPAAEQQSPTNAQAQELANEASQVLSDGAISGPDTQKRLAELRQEAVDKDLLSERITVKSRSGSLKGLLTFCDTSASRKA